MGPRRVALRRVGAQNFALFFPSPAYNFILCALSGSPCASRGGPVWWGRQTQRAQTCILKGPCLQKHHRNSTRRRPERAQRVKILGGRTKKRAPPQGHLTSKAWKQCEMLIHHAGCDQPHALIQLGRHVLAQVCSALHQTNEDIAWGVL